MAKAGTKRPNGSEGNKNTHPPKNEQPPVPEIQGKAKSGKQKANLIHH